MQSLMAMVHQWTVDFISNMSLMNTCESMQRFQVEMYKLYEEMEKMAKHIPIQHTILESKCV